MKGIPQELQRGLKTTFYGAPDSFSAMVGLRKSNKLYFAAKYPDLRLKFAVDSRLTPE